VLSEEARERRNEYSRESRKWYKDHGYCVVCKQNRARPNRVSCEECSAKNIEYVLKKRESLTEEEKEARRAYYRDYYRRKKEEGLCPRCGTRKATNGIYCIDCHAKHLKSTWERREAKKKVYDQANGICRFCDNPVEEGLKVCEYHHKELIERGKKGRETQREQGPNWFQMGNNAFWASRGANNED
jgi:hypothetical protein